MIKIRLFAEAYQGTRELEVLLKRAELHRSQYQGTDPVLLKLHRVNVEWRKDRIAAKKHYHADRSGYWAKYRERNQ